MASYRIAAPHYHRSYPIPAVPDSALLRLRVRRVQTHIAALARARGLSRLEAASLLQPQLQLFGHAVALYAHIADRTKARAFLFERDCAVEARTLILIATVQKQTKRMMG